MKLINLLTLILILTSCNDNTIYCGNIQELKTPLRVISLGSSDWNFNTVVVVIDTNNNLYTLHGVCFESLKVGDTIK